MKAYTDINQSKKLAEILPIESADMCYPLSYEEGDKPLLEQGGFGFTPCWSLTALFNYLREIDFFSEIDADKLTVIMNIDSIMVNEDNFIDACVEMILKLHEQKLL